LAVTSHPTRMSPYRSLAYFDHENNEATSVQQGEPVPDTETFRPSEDDLNAKDLAYFRSLPEHILQRLYPGGIQPPSYLGPATPYDKYIQFHEAILHLAAGLSLKRVIKKGHFDITEGEFVHHLAKFCARSLDYGEADFARTRAQYRDLDDDEVSHIQDSEGEAETLTEVVDRQNAVVEESKPQVAMPEGWLGPLMKVWKALSLIELLQVLTRQDP
jgi:hypothetical protein